MNMLKTAAIATAFAASLIPLSAMAVNQPLICMGQRIDVGATYAELVQSCGKPLSTSQTGEGLVLNYRIRGSGNTKESDCVIHKFQAGIRRKRGRLWLLSVFMYESRLNIFRLPVTQKERNQIN